MFSRGLGAASESGANDRHEFELISCSKQRVTLIQGVVDGIDAITSGGRGSGGCLFDHDTFGALSDSAGGSRVKSYGTAAVVAAACLVTVGACSAAGSDAPASTNGSATPGVHCVYPPPVPGTPTSARCVVVDGQEYMGGFYVSADKVEHPFFAKFTDGEWALIERDSICDQGTQIGDIGVYCNGQTPSPAGFATANPTAQPDESK